MNSLFQKLQASFSVSGFEKEIREIIVEELKNIKGNLIVDKVGNIIFSMGNELKENEIEKKEKLMIITAMDSKGVMAVDTEEEGAIKFLPIGKINIEEIKDKDIVFNSGAVGKVMHSKDNPQIDDLSIDLTVYNSKKSSVKVSPGEPGKIVNNFQKTTEGYVGEGLSSKITPYILINVIKNVVEALKNDLTKEVYFVFAVQSKIGAKGARAAANYIKPDKSIVLGTETCIESKENVLIGKGPILNVMENYFIIDEGIKNTIERIALENKIEIQKSISKSYSDEVYIIREAGGISTGTIAIPVKNKDTKKEIIANEDIDKVIELIKTLVLEK